MPRPNILIYMTDQEQAQVSFPEHPCQMPHTARFASEGILFRNCLTVAAHCCPSRASFMTGMYPSRHGVYNNVNTHTAINRGLNEDVVTFSELLDQAGYKMAFSGKWHVSNHENPRDKGWDEIHVSAPGDSDHGTPSPSRWEAAAREPDDVRASGQILRPGWGRYQLYGTQEGKEGYKDSADYRYVSGGIGAMESLAAGGEPWCLFVGPNGPHDPFIVPEPYASMYDPAEIDLPESYADTMEDKPAIYRRMRKQYWDQLSEDEVKESIAHYWGYCTMMDDMFGELLEALEKSGAASNTLVIRMSDHGEYCGAHGLYCKGVPPFREAYQVPLSIRWPDGIKDPGRECEALVNLMDFAPTFLEVAGIEETPEAIAGASLTPLFAGATPEEWRETHYTQFNGVELYYTQRVVQTEAYKYVYNGFDFDELYDLHADPHEMRNVADHEDYQDVKRELVKRMWQTALDQNDIITNPYATVAMAPWGPGIAFE